MRMSKYSLCSMLDNRTNEQVNYDMYEWIDRLFAKQNIDELHIAYVYVGL